MKKKITLLLAIWINISYICLAQPSGGQSPRAEELQKTYLTKELSLTAEESPKFFSTYKNYRNEIRATRKDKGDDELEFEESVLAVRRKYKPEFKSILGSDERVNKIFVAEKNFKEILRKELLKRNLNALF
jgi:hypothetical protein